jgi:hypothetical protein
VAAVLADGTLTSANGVKVVSVKPAAAGNMEARPALAVARTSAEACPTASSSVLLT